MKLRIKTVDLYGYNGRDFHPSVTDEGLIVHPLSMTTWLVDCEGGMDLEIKVDRSGKRWFPDASCKLEFTDAEWQRMFAGDLSVDDGRWGIMRTYLAVTEDGRVLELIDHEVEVVQ